MTVPAMSLITANLVAQAFSGPRSRMAFASYNFSGDLGKMAFPAATAGLVALMPWRSATVMLGVAALAGAAAILAVRGLPARTPLDVASEKSDAASRAAPDGRGFPLLLAIAVIDSATRMGFLTFLPLLLK